MLIKLTQGILFVVICMMHSHLQASLTPVNELILPVDDIPGARTGSVTLAMQPAKAIHLRTIKDRFKVLNNQDLLLHKLPALQVDLIQSGTTVIPSIRGIQKMPHPYWEWLIEPGVIGSSADGMTQIALPIALSERNANCTHNGLLVAQIDSSKQGTARLQIAAETCAYLKFDMELEFTVAVTINNSIGEATQHAVVTNYAKELSSRLPVKPLSSLVNDIDIEDSQQLYPPAQQDISVLGLVYNDTLYTNSCAYRSGEYPFCDRYALPSYSLAKSIVAGLSYLSLSESDPKLAQTLVTDLIPECKAGKWAKVTLNDLINMTTGRYDSGQMMVDESSADTWQFFATKTAADKIERACEIYTKHGLDNRPFVYHTTDHFLAGVLMTRYLRKHKNDPTADLYKDIITRTVFKELHLSPLMNDIKRTADNKAYPFTGWGLTFLVSDLALILNELIPAQRSHESKGAIPELSHLLSSGAPDKRLTYKSGFWQLNTKNEIPCEKETIPFMSGYGGISVVLQEQFGYFVFKDDEQFNWLNAIKALHSAKPLCKGKVNA